jgi:hypothetical protein
MPRPTRQQSAARMMSLLKMDMISLLDETPERFLRPYQFPATMEEMVNDTVNVIVDFMRQSHRIAVLANLYYLGELFALSEDSRHLWRSHVNNHILPNHGRYYRAATRVYRLFKGDMYQIYRTRYMSMHYISGMTNRDFYHDLVPYVENLGSEDFAF